MSCGGVYSPFFYLVDDNKNSIDKSHSEYKNLDAQKSGHLLLARPQNPGDDLVVLKAVMGTTLATQGIVIDSSKTYGYLINVADGLVCHLTPANYKLGTDNAKLERPSSLRSKRPSQEKSPLFKPRNDTSPIIKSAN
ncbi:hypothetical protein [Absidia glauca]|uniref:Uncharacterized protein n=1 Tax=Absidia glauca TaxID=4829 RepID=A0A163JJ91_ABSGL|nr:hypothetical protein [Absidia glauca]